MAPTFNVDDIPRSDEWFNLVFVEHVPLRRWALSVTTYTVVVQSANGGVFSVGSTRLSQLIQAGFVREEKARSSAQPDEFYVTPEGKGWFTECLFAGMDKQEMLRELKAAAMAAALKNSLEKLRFDRHNRNPNCFAKATAYQRPRNWDF